jgi:glycolate oxidase
MVGSEGTLGVFTQIVLRLLPRTKQSMILLLSYDNLDSAIATVPRILRSGVIPLGIEYVEKDCIIPTAKMLGKTWPADGDAFLIIIVDGNTDEELYSICEDISNIGEQNGALDALIAERKDEQETIMDIRSNIYEGLKSESIEILDVGVPPSEIAKFAKKVKDLSSRIGIPVLMYGHAGDGNIHIHPMKTGLNNNWKEKYTQTKKMIFEVGKSFGGVITAEHGVGALKINDLQYTLSADELAIMKQIKQLFDPNNIMNPGKVIPPPNKQR